MQISAIIVHGMGRTPLSMHKLASRLRKKGIQSHCFGYCAALESFDDCRLRLSSFIESNCGKGFFVLIGHSLGSVLLRSVMPKLCRQPLACFFLAPPTKACRAARFMGTTFLYRLAMGNMGQLLCDEKFMSNLPIPNVPTTVYAGTAGPCVDWLPHQNEKNDGILSVSETELSESNVKYVKSLHSFIMNSPVVIDDIVSTIDGLRKDHNIANGATP